jgi:Peptidase family M23
MLSFNRNIALHLRSKSSGGNLACQVMQHKRPPFFGNPKGLPITHAVKAILKHRLAPLPRLTVGLTTLLIMEYVINLMSHRTTVRLWAIHSLWLALLPAPMLHAQSNNTLGKEANAILALAESLYPSLFNSGSEIRTTQGYLYRFYPKSGIYVGFKDGHVYLLGGQFGATVRDMGLETPLLGSLQLSQAHAQSIVSTEPVPQLQNLGLISLDDVQLDQNALRDFAIHKLKGFYIFGDALSGGRNNPNFEYASLKESTRVVASIDGVVAFIRAQPETNDFEVFLQPKEGSAWTVGYDHLVNLTVTRGDQVKAGAVLGQPARQNNGLLRFEMQINQDVGTVTTHFCPSFLLAPAVKPQLLAELATLQNSWETFSNLDLYDVAKQNPVGCTKPTMSVKEAEGG